MKRLLNKLTQNPKKHYNLNSHDQKKTFSLKPPIQIERSRMIGLTSPEVYNSIFEITEEHNNFELYSFPDSMSGGVSYGKV